MSKQLNLDLDIKSSQTYPDFEFLVDTALLKEDFILTERGTVEINLSTKIVWSYMLHKYERCKSQGMIYQQTQQSIADSLSISLRTLRRCLADLEQLGVVESKKHYSHGFVDLNSYVVKSWVGYV